MKVVHLTSVHDASDVRIFHKQCKTLAEAGYEVVLVVPGNEAQSPCGIRIRAVPQPSGRWERVTRTVRQVYFAALNEKASVYHFHDPELIPIGLLLKLAGKRVIYDVHEDLPRQILNKEWIFSPVRNIAAKSAETLEMMAGRLLDTIITATPGIARRFPSKKSLTIHNFPELEDFKNGLIHYNERPSVVAYVGEITETRGIKEMVAAISLVAAKVPVKLVLAGTFSSPELEAQMRTASGWDRVDFLGRQGRNEIAHLLTHSRIGLALLHPCPNYLESYPTKLFEYMAAGTPVVASDFPLWRQIVQAEGCGFLVDPLKPERIAGAIEWLLKHPGCAAEMGNAGRQAVIARYNWGREAEKLKGAYSRFT